MGIRATFAIALLAALNVGATAVDATAQGIEGTYRFVSRDLPDGTVVEPPAIQGLITWTEGYRNFNIYWEEPDGTPVSIGYIAEYELTDDTYTETSRYRWTTEGTGGEPVYDLEPETGTGSVMREEGRITIDLPLANEPTIVFEDGTLTATEPGVFVDHWEKVD